MTSTLALLTNAKDFERELAAALEPAISFSLCTPAFGAHGGEGTLWAVLRRYLDKLDRAYVALEGMRSETWALHFLRNTGRLRIVPAADGSFRVNLIRVKSRRKVTVFLGAGELTPPGLMAPAMGMVKWSGGSTDPFALQIERLLSSAAKLAVAPDRAQLTEYWHAHKEALDLREEIERLGAPFVKPRVDSPSDLRVVDSRTGIADAVRQIKNAFREGGREVRQRVGYPGGSVVARIHWLPRLGVWAMLGTLEQRYWLAFGIDPPNDRRSVPICLEINVSKAGVDRRVAGVIGRTFLMPAEGERAGPAEQRAETDRLYLLHRGRIGGGTRGVGNELFWSRYGVGARLVESNREEPSRVAVVAEIGSQDFLRDVAAFVYQVVNMKRPAL